MYIYHDGNWDVDSGNNLIAPLNFSFLFGCGIFDTQPIYNQKPLCLDFHLERLFNSISFFSIPFDHNPEEIRDIINAGIEKFGVKEGRIRIIVDFGTGSKGDYFLRSKNASLVVLMFGAKLHTTGNIWKLTKGWFNRSRSNIIFKHKTTSIMENYISRERLKGSEFNEAIVSTDDGVLLECIFSNIFYLKDNIVHTPSLELPILNGTMRRYVLEKCAEKGIETKEVVADLSVLNNTDGVFITNSISGLVSIGQFDDLAFPLDNPLLQKLAKECNEEYFQ